MLKDSLSKVTTVLISVSIVLTGILYVRTDGNFANRRSGAFVSPFTGSMSVKAMFRQLTW